MVQKEKCRRLLLRLLSQIPFLYHQSNFINKPGHLSPRHFIFPHEREICEGCKSKTNSVDFIKSMINLKVNPKTLNYLKRKYRFESILGCDSKDIEDIFDNEIMK